MRSRHHERPEDAEISQGGSSFEDLETSLGGADAVPDTPDDTVEDAIRDADRGEFDGAGGAEL